MCRQIVHTTVAILRFCYFGSERHVYSRSRAIAPGVDNETRWNPE